MHRRKQRMDDGMTEAKKGGMIEGMIERIIEGMKRACVEGKDVGQLNDRKTTNERE